MCCFKCPFCVKLESHMLHLKSFFPSWTHAMCPFKCPFRAKFASHILHLKRFFPSWTDSLWFFKLELCVKLALHMLHLKGLFSSCTDAMCPFKCPFCANLESQTVHLKGFFPSWTYSLRFFKLDFTKCKFNITNIYRSLFLPKEGNDNSWVKSVSKWKLLLRGLGTNPDFHRLLCVCHPPMLESVQDCFDQVGHETMYASSGNRDGTRNSSSLVPRSSRSRTFFHSSIPQRIDSITPQILYSK